jgi:hypothetical protein
MEEVASDQVMEVAYEWLRRRKRYPDFSDIRMCRPRWPQEKLRLQEDLRAGRYRFGLLTRVRLESGEEVDMCLPAMHWLGQDLGFEDSVVCRDDFEFDDDLGACEQVDLKRGREDFALIGDGELNLTFHG